MRDRVVEHGVVFETGTPVGFRFLRSRGKAPYYGSRFQQDIEPAGVYILHNPAPGDLGTFWRAGTAYFESPLVIAFHAKGDVSYDEDSWKAHLHDEYGKTGRALSRALLRDGYDAIVTAERGGTYTKEIVALKPTEQLEFDPSENPSADAVRAVASEHLQQSDSLDDALASLARHRRQTLHTPYGQVKTDAVIEELRSYRPRPLPPGPRVLVHHSTDEAAAARLLQDGFIPAAKPMNLARARYEAGEYAEFAPGRGISGGLYVGLPRETSGYGKVTLEVNVPRAWLQVPPEQEARGVTDPMQALRSTDGAVILEPIPATALRRRARENPKES